MAATVPWNKSPYMKKCMTQADPLKEVSTFERMNGRPQLIFSNKMAYYCIELATPSGILKKKYMLPLQKFDASNRFS